MTTLSAMRRVWGTGCCVLALLACVYTLAACSAHQPPSQSSYQRQAEMEDAALSAVAGERSDPRSADLDDSAEPSPGNGGTADVMGQIGVALMSVFIALGNVILPFLMLL